RSPAACASLRGARAGLRRPGPLKPPSGQLPARTWLTCWDAVSSAACGWLLPSSTDTTMVERIVEICGYCGICGRACLTLPRLLTNVLISGCTLFICWSKPAALATDCLIGRLPVCTEKYLTWAGADSHTRNCSAALTWAEPL